MEEAFKYFRKFDNFEVKVLKELTDDKFYQKLNTKYSKCLLDYVLLEFVEEYQGEVSHKQAILEAFQILNSRVRVGNSLKHPVFWIEENKMKSIPCSVEDFLCLPKDEPQGCAENEVCKTPESPHVLPYWFAFLEPPYPNGYTKEDFLKLNHLLFPEAFQKDLEIFQWDDAFSNYFDDGKEWWGTGFWSIYDKWMNRFVIIGASLSD